jgi:hypothetical protein
MLLLQYQVVRFLQGETTRELVTFATEMELRPALAKVAKANEFSVAPGGHLVQPKLLGIQTIPHLTKEDLKNAGLSTVESLHVPGA